MDFNNECKWDGMRMQLHERRYTCQELAGFIPKPNPLPEWTDIKQYLKYLNLDEPIIGLNELVEEEGTAFDDGQVHLRYSCKICGVAMDMWTMVFHIVSRKHRSKYLQKKRPDLLKNSENIQKQPSLVRSLAANLAKQEGWGTPVVLNRPSRDKSPKTKHQGHGMTEGLDTYAHKRSYSGRNQREQSPLAEDSYRGSYKKGDAPRRPSRYHEDDLYDGDNYAHSRSYAEDDRNKRAYYQETNEGPYQDDEHYDSPYPEGNSVRSFGDEDDGRRRHADIDLRPEYYRSKHQDEGYAERNPRRGWNSSGDAQEDPYHGSARGNRFVDRAMRQRDGSEDYSLAPAPAKKKKKSRFSDATPLEMEMTQNRFMADMIHTNNPKGAVPIGSLVYGNRYDSDGTHASLNQGNVLDMLDDIKIENMDEANFMKEKLCSLVKEFHANKVQRSGTQVTQCVRDYNHGNDNWLDQSNDLQDSGHLDDQGFGEATRYEHDPRDFRERRYSEDQHILHKDVADNPAVFQKAKIFVDNPRVFQNERQFGDNPSSFEQAIGFENTSRDFQHEGRFEENLANFQHARSFEENTRTDHTNELSRSFQNVRHVRSTEEHRSYEKYDRRGEGGYGERDFRNTQNSLEAHREYEWGPRGGISSERSQEIKDYHRADDRRDYQESHWKSTSLREDEKVYGESQARRPHYRHDFSSGAEPYDPFQPSSSPPLEGAPPSSLEKLASTLLELVARKAN